MEKKHILVTGVNGFVGPHLVRELLKRDCAVYGIGYGPNVIDAPQDATYHYASCDLTNPEDVAKNIDLGSVDTVIHLAGLSSPAQSFEQPQRYIADNSAMLVNLFEAALKGNYEKLPRFIVVSTGAFYDGSQEMPLTEASRILFNSPYSISKATNEHVTDYYRLRGFETVIIRPFNHTGPGQALGFIVPDLTEKVMAAGVNGTITVGNLTTRRDYSDVRDVVRAYADVALAPDVKAPLYNVCSGKGHSGEEILQMITTALYGGGAVVKTEIDESRVRPNDIPEIVGSAEHLRQDYGWEPAIPFEQTVQDYVSWAKANSK